jgi:hypothetical protein
LITVGAQGFGASTKNICVAVTAVPERACDVSQNKKVVHLLAAIG